MNSKYFGCCLLERYVEEFKGELEYALRYNDIDISFWLGGRWVEIPALKVSACSTEEEFRTLLETELAISKVLP